VTNVGSRRRFLLAAGLGVAGLGAAAVTPGFFQRAAAARQAGVPVVFTPPDDYQELPADCYSPALIQPGEIILHWDGNRNGRELWKAVITYQTLAYVRQSAHFAVDDGRALQMLPMYRRSVQESYGAMGYNWIAINVEMAGRDFDLPEFAPAEPQVARTLRLVSQLMDFYHLPFEKVVGHYERDDRGLKQDPGVKFMASFREKLLAYRAALSPVKRQLLTVGP
jgi:hypothetical protein